MAATLPSKGIGDKLYKGSVLIMIIGPFLSLFIAFSQLWNKKVGLKEIGMLVGTYIPISLGVTMGMHRLFTHRSYEVPTWLRFVIGVFAELSLQGKILKWVSDHNRHHKFSDQEKDPHSPIYGEAGLLSFIRAHMLWFFTEEDSDPNVYATHLVDDPVVGKLDKHFSLFTLASIFVPYILWGKKGLIWGGLVRIFFVHHVTWSINSICHIWGEQPYKTTDNSRNVAILSVVTMGESNHNTHHAFPKSARHGTSFWNDPTYMVIKFLEWLGLAWKVWVPKPEDLEKRRRKAA